MVIAVQCSRGPLRSSLRTAARVPRASADSLGGPAAGAAVTADQTSTVRLTCGSWRRQRPTLVVRWRSSCPLAKAGKRQRHAQ